MISSQSNSFDLNLCPRGESTITELIVLFKPVDEGRSDEGGLDTGRSDCSQSLKPESVDRNISSKYETIRFIVFGRSIESV